MDQIEQLAQAALARDHLKLRSLVQDLIRANKDFSRVPCPSTRDSRLLAITASLVELLALRQQQTPPAWTSQVEPLKEPFYMLESAASMKRLRTLCETQSPEPMRKRRLYAPPHFLEFA